MREWGYDVKVEVLNAEQYGVPQTRKRAILVARRGGDVHMPKPTHSRYYSRTPEKLDAGVQKWVSMAEALGWGMTERPSITITGGSGRQGGPDPLDGGSGARATIRSAKESGAWEGDATRRASLEDAAAIQSYPSSRTICHGVQKNSARRPIAEPAATIAFGHDSASVGFASADVGDHVDLRAAKADGRFDAITVAQAGVLQSYERPFIWCGTKTKQFLQIGNAVPPLLAESILAALIGIKEGR